MKKDLTKSVLIFTFALVFLFGSLYSQSRETGAIEGKVIDASGVALPGAEVKLSSPNLMGGTRSTVTKTDGRYRFSGLPPGTYDIEASLSGFTPEKKEGIRLFVAKTLTLQFELGMETLETEIVVTAVAPLIDLKDSSLNTFEITTETMTDVIFSRDFYPYFVMNLAPGGYYASYHGTSAFGGVSRTGNAYEIDGVEISDQSSGRSAAIIDSDALEEMKVLGLGAAAEYDGFQGALLSMVSKSGGNTFDGMSQFVFSDFPWMKDIVDSSDPKFALFSAPLEMKYLDARIGLGGPIFKDKLWFYVSGRYVKRQQKYQDSVHDKLEPKYFVKLTFQPHGSTRLSAFRELCDFSFDYKYPTPTRPKEATSFEYAPVWVHAFTGLTSFSENTFTEYKLSYVVSDLEMGGYGGGYPGTTVSGRYNELTGMYSENYDDYYHVSGYRFQANVSVSHHASDFIKGSHDFKFGVEYGQVGETRENYYNGGIFYHDNVYSFSDHQYHTYGYEASTLSEPKGKKIGLFAQDAWRISDNFTINAGIRNNIYRGYLKSLGTTPFKTGAFLPRIGFTWDLFGDGTTALKAHYGIYAEKMKTNLFSAASSGLSDRVQYEVMPNGDLVEVFRVSRANPAIVDPDVKMPQVHQFTFGLEREIAKDLSGSISFVYRKFANFLDDVNIGARYEEVPFTFTDEKGVEQTLYAYEKTSPSSSDQFSITNPTTTNVPSMIAVPINNYMGMFIEVEKRFSDKYMFKASYTLSKQNEISYSGNPNTQLNSLWEGDSVGYWFHNIKMWGTYVLPLEIRVSPTIELRNGTRWTRQVRAPVPGNPYLYIEKPNINTHPFVIRFDLRVEKTFTIKNDIRVGFMADVYNILNRLHGDRFMRTVSNISSNNFGLYDRYNEGRQFRIGVRIYY